MEAKKCSCCCKTNPDANIWKVEDKAKGILMPLLQEVQSRDSFISQDAMEKISEDTGIPVSTIYGVVTFYTQFRTTPVGKYLIKVCHGTACHVNGAGAITNAIEEVLHIKEGENTEDMKFTLENVACLGCCSLAPVIMINDETYGNLTPDSVKKVINEYKEKE